MEKREYELMAQNETSFWWHVGKLELLKSLVEMYSPRTEKYLNILEIGCGTGENTSVLSSLGKVTGIDISEEALKFYKKSNKGPTICTDINELDITPYLEKFDLILALDVLEHIQEDTETMRRARKMLKPDGLFIINVPAYKFLWSEHDEALHHKRRYHSIELKSKLKDSGFTIIKKTHFVGISFLGIAAFRIWNNFFRRNPYPKSSYVILPKALNEIMAAILKFEAKLIKHVNIPIGTTLAVVAKKT